MGTSRVRLLSAGTITMALKPPLSSLYCYPGLSGFEAFPRRHSLHGVSYPWVSGSNAVVALLLWHFTWATPYLGDTCSRRRLILATLPLGDASPLGVASPRRCLMLTSTSTLTLTLTLATPGYGMVQFLAIYVSVLGLFEFYCCFLYVSYHMFEYCPFWIHTSFVLVLFFHHCHHFL